MKKSKIKKDRFVRPGMNSGTFTVGCIVNFYDAEGNLLFTMNENRTLTLPGDYFQLDFRNVKVQPGGFLVEVKTNEV